MLCLDRRGLVLCLGVPLAARSLGSCETGFVPPAKIRLQGGIFLFFFQKRTCAFAGKLCVYTLPPSKLMMPTVFLYIYFLYKDISRHPTLPEFCVP